MKHQHHQLTLDCLCSLAMLTKPIRQRNQYSLFITVTLKNEKDSKKRSGGLALLRAMPGRVRKRTLDYKAAIDSPIHMGEEIESI